MLHTHTTQLLSAGGSGRYNQDPKSPFAATDATTANTQYNTQPHHYTMPMSMPIADSHQLNRADTFTRESPPPPNLARMNTFSGGKCPVSCVV